VECRPEPTEGQSATAALGPTTEAFGRALEAGAAHASAQAALERLDRELGATRRRRRAIEQRLMPDLEASLHRLDVELDERDREAAVRGRLAAARSGEGRP
jgi:V/A-type H+-transporting ATPase subunit D